MSTLALIDFIGEAMARCSVVISRWQIRIRQNLLWAQSVQCGVTYAVTWFFPCRPLAHLYTIQCILMGRWMMLIFVRNIVHETKQRYARLLAWVHACISHCFQFCPTVYLTRCHQATQRIQIKQHIGMTAVDSITRRMTQAMRPKTRINALMSTKSHDRRV